jgi:hypothetical protein
MQDCCAARGNSGADREKGRTSGKGFHSKSKLGRLELGPLPKISVGQKNAQPEIGRRHVGAASCGDAPRKQRNLAVPAFLNIETEKADGVRRL